jgi:hypothetical protein
MTLQDVMLDIETLSTQSDACILTIGAIKFSRNRYLLPLEQSDTFYRRISKESCDAAGLHTDPSTVEWWMKQSDDAKYEVFTEHDRVSIKNALYDFSEWFGNSRFIWGHGSVFDVTILNNAYRAHDMQPPWNFWNVRDTRTLYDIGNVSVKSLPKENAHHAVHDCYRQIVGVHRALRNLGM